MARHKNHPNLRKIDNIIYWHRYLFLNILFIQMDFDRYSDYFEYVGHFIFDAYIMNLIENEFKGLKFVTNNKHDQYIKYKISWRLDLDTFEFDKAEFVSQLSKTTNASIIVANISLNRTKDGTQGHRNVLIIDLSNKIFHLFEPNLWSNCMIARENLEGEKERREKHIEIHQFFQKIIEDHYSMKFKSTILSNYGASLSYVINNTIKNEKLISLIKFSSCTLYCYWFIKWLLRKDDKLLRGDIDISKEEQIDILHKIFSGINEKEKDANKLKFTVENCSIITRLLPQLCL